MDISSVAQPTTIIGLAGLSIGGIVFLVVQFNKNTTSSQVNFIKKLFSFGPTYTLGAHESPLDTRRILTTTFQVLITLPLSYKTDISMLPVENQGGIGS